MPAPPVRAMRRRPPTNSLACLKTIESIALVTTFSDPVVWTIAHFALNAAKKSWRTGNDCLLTSLRIPFRIRSQMVGTPAVSEPDCVKKCGIKVRRVVDATDKVWLQACDDLEVTFSQNAV